jgi:hypothetical protein
MQSLLQKLAEKMNPGAVPRLKWIQATVGTSIQMIPVEDVLFFISDEKYTRVQTASLEALIRKPIKELVAELDADSSGRSTARRSSTPGDRRRQPRPARPPAGRGARPPREARGEPQLRGALQGHVGGPGAGRPLRQRADQEVGVEGQAQSPAPPIMSPNTLGIIASQNSHQIVGERGDREQRDRDRDRRLGQSNWSSL